MVVVLVLRVVAVVAVMVLVLRRVSVVIVVMRVIAGVPVLAVMMVVLVRMPIVTVMVGMVVDVARVGRARQQEGSQDRSRQSRNLHGSNLRWGDSGGSSDPLNAALARRPAVHASGESTPWIPE
jgi:hypothetical protein